MTNMEGCLWCTDKSKEEAKEHLYVRVPKITPKFSGLLGGLIRLSIRLYSWLWFITAKEHKTKSGEGKGTRGKAQRHKLPKSSPSGVTAAVLNSSGNGDRTVHVKYGLPGSLIRERPRVLLRGWSHRHSLFQNSRYPAGKQVSRIHCIVCTNNLGTVSHSDWSWEWWESCQIPSFQTPAQGKPCKQAFLWISRLRLALLALFSTTLKRKTKPYDSQKTYLELEELDFSSALR